MRETGPKPAKAPLPNLFHGMNKTEQARAQELEAMRRTDRIAAWWYEKLTFRIGADCRYTPDFVVQENDGELRLEETKGHMREDALVKLRALVEQYPFRLTLYTGRPGAWTVREFTRG